MKVGVLQRRRVTQADVGGTGGEAADAAACG